MFLHDSLYEWDKKQYICSLTDSPDGSTETPETLGEKILSALNSFRDVVAK
jgi:hypothetical protein